MRSMSKSSARWSSVLGLLALIACSVNSPPPGIEPGSPRAQAFLATLEQRTLAFFGDRSAAQTGLRPNRWPTLTFSSIAAVAFALTASPIGVEPGYVPRAQAAVRTLATLRWFWQA